jgi:hypothetical protein
MRAAEKKLSVGQFFFFLHVFDARLCSTYFYIFYALNHTSTRHTITVAEEFLSINMSLLSNEVDDRYNSSATCSYCIKARINIMLHLTWNVHLNKECSEKESTQPAMKNYETR